MVKMFLHAVRIGGVLFFDGDENLFFVDFFFSICPVFMSGVVTNMYYHVPSVFEV